MHQKKRLIEELRLMEIYESHPLSYIGLLSLLSKLHFIYKDKERLLQPYQKLQQKTWNILLQNPQYVAHHTFLSSDNQMRGICSSWRATSKCWCIQNGIADRIRDYIKTIAIESTYLLSEPSAEYIQTWFRPENVIVKKMCGYGTNLDETEGVYSEVISCLLWDPTLSSIKKEGLMSINNSFERTALQDFLEDNCSPLFCASEDIANDPTLESINTLFQGVGLYRTRSIDVICSASDIQAVLLSYYSSPGINFSFLENQTEIIVGKNVTLSPELIEMISLVISKNNKTRIVPGPIITNKRTGDVLMSHGATLLREYVHRIWTKRTYADLYEYILNKYF